MSDETRTDGFWSAEAREGSVTLLRCRGCGHLSRWGDPPCCVSPKGCDPVEYVDLDRLRPIVERMIEDERPSGLLESSTAEKLAEREAELAACRQFAADHVERAAKNYADGYAAAVAALTRERQNESWSCCGQTFTGTADFISGARSAHVCPPEDVPDAETAYALGREQGRADLDAAGRKLAEAGEVVANTLADHAGANVRNPGNCRKCQAVAEYRAALADSPWGAS